MVPTYDTWRCPRSLEERTGSPKTIRRLQKIGTHTQPCERRVGSFAYKPKPYLFVPSMHGFQTRGQTQLGIRTLDPADEANILCSATVDQMPNHDSRSARTDLFFPLGFYSRLLATVYLEFHCGAGETCSVSYCSSVARQ